MYNSKLFPICVLTAEKKSPYLVGSENGILESIF